ncbi:RNA binding S1 domain-containing protein [Thermincola ferriacetica]|uniref:RNA binding S1 domain protein n=2 Tax=Thermincola TaxID=278993 RepID=D5X9K9_THEPJ|nr:MULTISPECIES: S1 RNA-binding domain-containing protein [Thermincola]ADG81080.1 RNA binding S1 domain protein [Thermincola potens JR]KNZ68889.1 RNA binding S1 domain-containing protein [Thermincola ferriacetica]
MAIEVGSILEGVVTGITNFGAFVELPGGETGLVHISEVAEAYVKDVKDYLKDKDKVKVKVIAIENGKIGLSIKQANPKPKHEKRYSASFEDMITKFMKDSDERQQDLRRSLDSKRGGRGRRR